MTARRLDLNLAAQRDGMNRLFGICALDTQFEDQQRSRCVSDPFGPLNLEIQVRHD
jgi:hypothetical protein